MSLNNSAKRSGKIKLLSNFRISFINYPFTQKTIMETFPSVGVLAVDKE